MSTYIILGQWTAEGIKNIKRVKERIEAAKKVTESFGGVFKEIYYTFGRYDFIAITEGLNNESSLKTLLTFAGAGAIRTETLVAFPSDQFFGLVDELP